MRIINTRVYNVHCIMYIVQCTLVQCTVDCPGLSLYSNIQLPQKQLPDNIARALYDNKARLHFARQLFL